MTSSVANNSQLPELHASSMTVDLASSRMFSSNSPFSMAQLTFMGNHPSFPILDPQHSAACRDFPD
jgi:hypothetical protein